MTLVPTKKATPFWVSWLKWGGLGLIALSSLFQCTNTAQINYRLHLLETRPTTVSIGRNSHVAVGKPLSEEENAIEFLREIMPMAHSLSSKLPKGLDPQCKKDPRCTQANDAGVEIQGVLVPSLVAYALNAFEPSYQKPFAKARLSDCPQWSGGVSCVYQITNIEPIEGERLKFLVNGALFKWSSDGKKQAAVNYDVKVSLKAVLPPKPKSNLNRAQEAIATALSRGLLVTFVEPV